MKIFKIKHSLIELVIPICLSNLIVYFLVSDGQDLAIPKEHGPGTPRKGFSHIKIKLIPFIPLKKSIGPVPVSIYSHKKKLLMPVAYLISNESQEIQQNETGQTFTSKQSSSKIYTVEIPNSKINSIIKLSDKVLLAYPPSPKSLSISTTPRRLRSYEIIF